MLTSGKIAPRRLPSLGKMPTSGRKRDEHFCLLRDHTEYVLIRFHQPNRQRFRMSAPRLVSEL